MLDWLLSSERACFMVAAFAAHELPLLGYQLFCDYLRRHNVWPQHRIQGDKVPPAALVDKATRQILVGHLLVQPVLLYFFYDATLALGMPGLFSPLTEPSALAFPAVTAALSPWLGFAVSTLLSFVVFVLVCDTLLYASHRALHSHPLLYTTFHKQHHEFHANVPLASEYFTPLEELTTGLIPTLAGPLLLRSHHLVTVLWLAFRIAESADAHSGYDFPYSIFRLGRPGEYVSIHSFQFIHFLIHFLIHFH